MDTIQSIIKTRLHKKGLTKASLGALAVECAKQFAVQPKRISGYIKGQTLFLRGGKQEHPTQWFLKKSEIVTRINDMYLQQGYAYSITDVRLQIVVKDEEIAC